MLTSCRAPDSDTPHRSQEGVRILLDHVDALSISLRVRRLRASRNANSGLVAPTA